MQKTNSKQFRELDFSYRVLIEYPNSIAVEMIAIYIYENQLTTDIGVNILRYYVPIIILTTVFNVTYFASFLLVIL